MSVRLTLIAVIVLSLAACYQADRRATGAKASRDERARALIAQQDAVVVELARLSDTDLLQRVAEDSVRGASTLDSLAFAELTKRGKSVAATLTNTMATDSNALALMALQAIDPVAYQSVAVDMRVRIVVSTLASTRNMIDFGLPHHRWGSMAKALVDMGPVALASLQKLLADKRAVVVSGSEAADEAQRYGYRVCDYAWALRMAIRGSKAEIPVSPDERDKLIAKD